MRYKSKKTISKRLDKLKKIEDDYISKLKDLDYRISRAKTTVTLDNLKSSRLIVEGLLISNIEKIEKIKGHRNKPFYMLASVLVALSAIIILTLLK